MGISSILTVMARCLGCAVWPLVAGIASAIVNTGLNYGLIFGRFGLPALGGGVLRSGGKTTYIMARFM